MLSMFFCNTAIKQRVLNLLTRVNKLAMVNALTPFVPEKAGRKISSRGYSFLILFKRT